MTRPSPIPLQPIHRAADAPGDGTDGAPAIPTAILLGERGTCPSPALSAHAQHVTLPTAADLGKLQYVWELPVEKSS